MSQLYDLVRSLLNDDVRDSLAARFGVGRDTTDQAVGVGLPALLGGLSNHAASADGANEILDRVKLTNGGGQLDSILDRLRSGPDDTTATDDAAFTDRVLGGGEGSGGILDALTSKLGLPGGAGGGLVGKLLAGLLPVVLGSLGKLGGLGGLSPSRLLGLLGDGASAAADDAPGGRSAIASLLGPLGAALGVGGAGAAASAAAAQGSEPAAAQAAASAPDSTPTDDGDRDRRAGALPWWLLAAAVLALGLIIAFANESCGDDDSAGAGGSTTTSQSTTDGGTATDGTTTDGDGSGDGAGTGSGSSGGATALTVSTAGAGAVTLAGPVSDDAVKAALAAAAGSAFGDANVDDQLTVDSGAAAGPAAEAVEAVLGALANAPRGWTAAFDGAGTLTLTGEVATEADKAAIVAAATQAFAPGTVVDQLTVAAGGASAGGGGASPEIDAINREIRLRGVNFVTGSADLTPASRTTLDRIAAILADATEVRAEVQGHTDNQGDAAANLTLSRQRAAAVVTYLVGQGVARSRLVARGFGETRPRATNNTEAGRAQNRRVVFRRLP